MKITKINTSYINRIQSNRIDLAIFMPIVLRTEIIKHWSFKEFCFFTIIRMLKEV